MSPSLPWLPWKADVKNRPPGEKTAPAQQQNVQPGRTSLTFVWFLLPGAHLLHLSLTPASLVRMDQQRIVYQSFWAIPFLTRQISTIPPSMPNSHLFATSSLHHINHLTSNSPVQFIRTRSGSTYTGKANSIYFAPTLFLLLNYNILVFAHSTMPFATPQNSNQIAIGFKAHCSLHGSSDWLLQWQLFRCNQKDCSLWTGYTLVKSCLFRLQIIKPICCEMACDGDSATSKRASPLHSLVFCSHVCVLLILPLPPHAPCPNI